MILVANRGWACMHDVLDAFGGAEKARQRYCIVPGPCLFWLMTASIHEYAVSVCALPPLYITLEFGMEKVIKCGTLHMCTCVCLHCLLLRSCRDAWWVGLRIRTSRFIVILRRWGECRKNTLSLDITGPSLSFHQLNLIYKFVYPRRSRGPWIILYRDAHAFLTLNDLIIRTLGSWARTRLQEQDNLPSPCPIAGNQQEISDNICLVSFPTMRISHPNTDRYLYTVQ